MRVFLQIIATLTFVLAGSQFTHGEEIVTADLHNHAHQAQVSHSSIINAHQAEMSGSDHCGAYLFSLAAAPGSVYLPHVQSFRYWRSDRLYSDENPLELPPPRA